MRSKLLVIDDVRERRTAIRQTLGDEDTHIISAIDAEAGLSLAAMVDPDVLLVSAELEDLDPHEVLRRVQRNSALRWTRVVVLGGQDREVELLQAGAHDVVARPFSPEILRARVAAAAGVARAQRELRHNADRLAELADRDMLTGALNRRGGQRVLERLLTARAEGRAGLGIALVDVDNLKALNDTDGHAAGDHALQLVTEAAGSVLRGGDVLVRWGGDEFVAVLVDANLEDAERVAARVRLAVAQVQEERPLSASVGIALARPGDSAATVIARADAAMYAEKTSQRR